MLLWLLERSGGSEMSSHILPGFLASMDEKWGSTRSSLFTTFLFSCCYGIYGIGLMSPLNSYVEVLITRSASECNLIWRQVH